MGVLEDLLNGDGRAPPWGRIAATFIGGLQVAQSGGGRVMDQLMQWGSHLARNASSRWAQLGSIPVFCEHPDCKGQALVECAACHRPHCLAHTLVSYLAEGVCERCARELVDSKKREATATAQRASERERVRVALHALRLPSDATWDDIRDQYKQLVVKHNADRPQSDAKRARNETRLKEINAAYALLRELHEREAA